jgi:hypothetical protein
MQRTVLVFQVCLNVLEVFIFTRRDRLIVAITIATCLAGCGGSASSVTPNTSVMTESHRSRVASTDATYATTVLGDSPIAFYPLSETTAGVLYDTGPNGLNGNTGSGVTLNTPAIVSDGAGSATNSIGPSANTFGHVPTNAKFNVTNAVTVEAWVKPSVTTSSYAPIAAYGTNAALPWESYLIEAEGSHFAFQLAVNGQPVRLDSSTPYQTNQTYHVVGTYDGSNMDIYVNGVLSASKSLSGSIGNFTSLGFLIGQSADYTHGFVGTIEDVAVYGNALSATQVAAHYASGNGGAGGGTAVASAVSATTAAVSASVLGLTASLGLSDTASSSSGPTHILTYQTPLTSSNTTFGSSFSTPANYLDYAITNGPDSVKIRSAGIKTGYYFDLHSVCSSNDFGACLIGSITIPESAFEHTCDGTNARITDTHSAGVTQYVTDATSSGLRQALGNLITGSALTGSWDFAYDDDAQDMSEAYPYMTFLNANTGAPQNPAPYCNFSESSYLAGMLSYYNSSSISIIANNLEPSGSSSASAGTKFFAAAPLIGGMLEGIYGSSFNGPSRSKESGSIWQSEENSELATANANRLFVGYEHVGGTDSTGIDQRNYIYASLMLSYSLNSTVLAEDAVKTNSGIQVNPEALLVPTSPLVGEPSNISSLQKSGGAYVREYANCYYSGKSIGQCAAVVNPNSSGSVSMPSFSQSYSHTAIISGAGVIPGVDNGSVNLNGPSAPSSIGAEEAYILTK